MKTWRELFNQASLERVLTSGTVTPATHVGEKYHDENIFHILDGPLMLLVEKDIPVFIQSSLYLQSLVSEGSWPTEGLEIPDGCAKKDLSVSSDTDLLELLSTIRFWLVPEIAEEFEDLPRYALASAEPNNFAGIAADFATDIPFVGELLATILAEDKVERACWYGRLGILKILCEELQLPLTEAAGMSAVQCGHVECLKYLHSRGLQLTFDMSVCASEHGRLVCLQFILEYNSRWSVNAVMYAAKSGNFECIKYAVSVNKGFSVARDAPELLEKVAAEGHLECVKLLLDEPSWPREACLDYVMRGAASGGHLEILQYGLENTNTSDRSGLPSIMSEAAGGGHIDCMQYLHAQGCAFDAEHMICAASGGHLDAMKFLHALNIPWEIDVCHAAAAGGHLECLKFARENGCPWRDRDLTGHLNEHEYNLIAAAAVQAPTLDCLEYVLSQGAYLSPECAHEAVISWSVAKLQFMHARGLTWRQESIDRAATWGWFEGVVFLHEIGVPWNEHTTEAAASNWHMEVLLYALRHGCPASEHVLEMVRNNEQTQMSFVRN